MVSWVCVKSGVRPNNAVVVLPGGVGGVELVPPFGLYEYEFAFTTVVAVAADKTVVLKLEGRPVFEF
jgi:hypothetical protein